MSTFCQDDLLPSLPLPELETTLTKYLESIQPFVDTIEYLQTEKIVNEFKFGLGKKLQFFLNEKAKNERNWLEKFWLDYAYLEWRLPIAPFINTTGFVIGSTDANFNKIPENYNFDIQLANLSLQIFFYCNFFENLRNETFPSQTSRNGENFSMDQFRRLFNTCRIPLTDKDRLDTHFKTVNEGHCPTHILVIYKYRFFKLEIYHENKLLNISEIYAQLEYITENYGKKPYGIGIGALSADFRNSWAQNRKYLIELDINNKKSFEMIEKSIYAVALDDTEANNNDQLAKLGLSGNPKNRFFDKSFTSIASKNGRLTSNVEHTPFDGMVSTTLVVYFIEALKKTKIDSNMVKSYEVRPAIKKPEEIEIAYDLKIENEIAKSAKMFEKYASQIELKELKIKTCKKEMVKSYKINPDTFSQICMQLAYYQLHKKPAPTYETATTRTYYHGRTETVRSCSKESIEWCKEMCNNDLKTRLKDYELLNLFKRAANKHDELMKEAKRNSGCDRHLLGLKLTAQQLELDLPELYTHSSWKKSGGDGNFIISSSFLGFSNSLGTCSPMCNNGYSMIYCYSDEGLTYSLGRYTTSNETDLEKMAYSLRSAVDQVQQLFQKDSKL